MKPEFLITVPVLPSANIERDVKRYEIHAGFRPYFADAMYAGIHRDGIWLHLQWHADTPDAPCSVVRSSEYL